MGRLRTLVVCGAALAISGAGARAADMSDYPSLPMPLPSEKSQRIDQLVSGWYLRGDIAYRFQHIGLASDLLVDYDESSVNDAYVGGVGVGYKAGWFRADVTGDYSWHSTYAAFTNSGSNIVKAKIDAATVLLNGYFDLGTWGGITPYVGAGIGGAQVNLRKYESFPLQPDATQSTSRWNMAWAAMAGVSVNLTYNVLLDIGYRHIDMGDVVGGPPSNEITAKKLTGDEVRVGLRFVLD